MAVRELDFIVDTLSDTELSGPNLQLRGLTRRAVPLEPRHIIGFEVLARPNDRVAVMRLTVDVEFFADYKSPQNGKAFPSTSVPGSARFVMNNKVAPSSLLFSDAGGSTLNGNIKYNGFTWEGENTGVRVLKDYIVDVDLTQPETGTFWPASANPNSHTGVGVHVVELNDITDVEGRAQERTEIISWSVQENTANIDPGDPEPYTKSLRYGDYRVSRIVMDRNANIEEQLAQFLNARGINRDSIVAQSLVTAHQSVLELYILYFETLAPRIIQIYPNQGAVTPIESPPDKLLFTFSSPVETSCMVDSAGILFDGAALLPADFDFSSDNTVMKLDISTGAWTGTATETGVHDFCMTGICAPDGRIFPSPPFFITHSFLEIAGGGLTGAPGPSGAQGPPGSDGTGAGTDVYTGITGDEGEEIISEGLQTALFVSDRGLNISGDAATDTLTFQFASGEVNWNDLADVLTSPTESGQVPYFDGNSWFGIPVGSESHYLTVTSGNNAWSDFFVAIDNDITFQLVAPTTISLQGDLSVDGPLTVDTDTGTGSILYFSQDTLTFVEPSNSGEFLHTAGDGFAPYWAPIVADDVPGFVDHTGDLTVHFDKASILFNDLGDGSNATVSGDLLYYDSDVGVYTGLPLGAVNTFLSAAGSLLQWKSIAINELNNVTATPTNGNIIYANGGAFINLTIGTSGEYLGVNDASTLPEWTTIPLADLPDIAWDDLSDVSVGGTSGQLPYTDGVFWTGLPIGAEGEVLTVTDGNIGWNTNPAADGATGFFVPQGDNVAVGSARVLNFTNPSGHIELLGDDGTDTIALAVTGVLTPDIGGAGVANALTATITLGGPVVTDGPVTIDTDTGTGAVAYWEEQELKFLDPGISGDYLITQGDGAPPVFRAIEADDVPGFVDHTGDLTIHYTEGSIDHTNIQNIGSNSHAQIDSQLADLSDSGVSLSGQILTNDADIAALTLSGVQISGDLADHEADLTIHFTEGSIDHGSIAGLTDDDHPAYVPILGGRAFSGQIDFASGIAVGSLGINVTGDTVIDGEFSLVSGNDGFFYGGNFLAFSPTNSQIVGPRLFANSTGTVSWNWPLPPTGPVDGDILTYRSALFSSVWEQPAAGGGSGTGIDILNEGTDTALDAGTLDFTGGHWEIASGGHPDTVASIGLDDSDFMLTDGSQPMVADMDLGANDLINVGALVLDNGATIGQGSFEFVHEGGQTGMIIQTGNIQMHAYTGGTEPSVHVASFTESGLEMSGTAGIYLGFGASATEQNRLWLSDADTQSVSLQGQDLAGGILSILAGSSSASLGNGAFDLNSSDLDLNFQGQIRGLETGTNDDHAVRKDYVDEHRMLSMVFNEVTTLVTGHAVQVPFDARITGMRVYRVGGGASDGFNITLNGTGIADQFLAASADQWLPYNGVRQVTGMGTGCDVAFAVTGLVSSSIDQVSLQLDYIRNS